MAAEATRLGVGERCGQYVGRALLVRVRHWHKEVTEKVRQRVGCQAVPFALLDDWDHPSSG